MIGERLFNLRKDRGMTQKELAEALFINYRTYSGYERNEIEASDDVKIQIAKFFNVSLDYLLGIIDEPRPIKNGNEYIRLPRPLSDAARKELEQFINYLFSKEKSK
jgi:transcriptional regulator with XRE-family HTH domain